MVSWETVPAILRSLPIPSSIADQVADVRWLHDVLARLAALGFPVPVPLPAFGGQSWANYEGAIWEVVSFLPGRSVGWSPRPPLEEIGEFLARYHQAARQIGISEQRSAALPLHEVPPTLLAADFQSWAVDQDSADVIRRLARELAHDLSETCAETREHLAIHGDFTNDNVIASGVPPKVTGVIDFALAHLETPLADIGYALWRSGRPSEYASYLDLSRVRRYMRGYAAGAPVSAAQADAIPAYLVGRGLQMIAKRLRRGQSDIGMLTEVQWLSANAHVLRDVLQSALRLTDGWRAPSRALPGYNERVTSAPMLIVVAGPPGSGKTTLAHKIAAEIGCPAICRDEIKEGMAHTVDGFVAGPGDELTVRTLPVFFGTLDLLIRAGVTIVAEAAFQDRTWRLGLEPLIDVADLRVVHCTVAADLAFRRSLRRRKHSPLRSAHPDPDPDDKAEWTRRHADFERLTLDAPCMEVDTTGGYRPTLPEVIAFVVGRN